MWCVLVLGAFALVVLLQQQECDGFTPRHSLLSWGMPHSMTTTTTTTKQWSRVDDSSDATAAAAATTPSVESSSSSSDDKVVAVPSSVAALCALDAVALLIFAAVGKASHASDGSIDFLATVTTAAPFLASWFLTSPLTSVYTNIAVSNQGSDDGDGDNSTTVKNMVVSSLLQTTKGWAVAIPLGCVGRGIIKGYVPPVPFVIVTLIATLVLLGTTRALFTVVSYKLQRQNQQ